MTAAIGLSLAAIPDGWWIAAGLALATLVSEDLACATAGQVIAAGRLHWLPAVAGCFLGIYVGDLLLWVVGRVFGRGLLRLPSISARLPHERLRRFAEWFDRRGGAAILAARFIPGTRLPLYLAAGTLGRKGGRFALWSFVAALVWTPVVVMFAAGVGRQWRAWARSLTPPVYAASAAGAVILSCLVIRFSALLATPVGRASVIARVSRIWRWEFWPAWLFYAPLVPWIAWQSLRRGGFHGFASITAANPGIFLGGFVGESKSDILCAIAGEHVLPAGVIKPGDPAARAVQLNRIISARGWSFPLILKPNVGQRGTGVAVARTPEDARRYLAEHPADTLVQVYHPGPHEAGVFYYRLPGEQAGRVFSITDKVFPELTGDGASTLEQLIWRHPRYRMQAKTFLARHEHQLQRVLDVGEMLRLTGTGNHCQGALFRDGSHLFTPELEHAIDRIARRFEGFHFGRFDVRYSEAGAFKAGRDLAVVELNGVTSESTDLYDPANRLWQAYVTLIRQWSILFRIADANRMRGYTGSGAAELMRAVRACAVRAC